MIVFGLDHLLDLQYEKTIAAVVGDFCSQGKYRLWENELTVSGQPGQVRISFAEQKAEYAEYEAAFSEEEKALEEDGAEDTPALSELLKFGLMMVRRWYHVEPYADDHMIAVLQKKLNKNLVSYNLQLTFSHRQTNQWKLEHGGREISLEKAVSLILRQQDRDEARTLVLSRLEEAERRRRLGQYREARLLYQEVLEREEKDTFLYTQAAFGLGEMYYFEDDLQKSAQSYEKCDVRMLPDEKNFYTRLGHACLDEKLKSYSKDMKIYYRSILSPAYLSAHEEEVRCAARELMDEFDEYENACRQFGEKTYINKKKISEV